jgi:hypothetical protein
VAAQDEHVIGDDQHFQRVGLDASLIFHALRARIDLGKELLDDPKPCVMTCEEVEPPADAWITAAFVGNQPGCDR